MRHFLRSALIVLCLTPSVARAQMALPGAVMAPTPEGQAGAPPSRPAHPAGNLSFGPHFTPAKPPGVESVVGKIFGLNGARGALQIEKAGAELRVSKLQLTGDKISAPNQACEIEMTGAGPVALKALGAPDGVLRFELQSSACPLVFDVLNGAVAVKPPAGLCTFSQADCRVDASGLWGPAGDSIGDAQIKSIERDRTTAETHVRAHFRGLLDKLSADKAATHDAVKDQAAFSASRAQTCRDYDREDAHGFCALRLTEARDSLLQLRLAGDKDAKEAKDAKDAKPKPAKKPKPRPAPVAGRPAQTASPVASPIDPPPSAGF